MRGLNKVTLIGNLGRDPEVQTIKGDIAVARFAIATNESYRDDKWKAAHQNRLASGSSLAWTSRARPEIFA